MAICKLTLFLSFPALGEDSGVKQDLGGKEEQVWVDHLKNLLASPVSAQLAAIVLDVSALHEGELTRKIEPIRALIQEAGIAFMLSGVKDSRFVIRCGADGAFFFENDDVFEEALAALRPKYMIGLGGLSSRHQAMEAGEKGVDVVVFGSPEAARPNLTEIAALSEWWSGVFNIPCIAFAQKKEDIAILQQTGTEFIGIDARLGEVAVLTEILGTL